ncbi:hypothetical protein DL93DRAFT_1222576 [Clavulina sp. PMI_390]|nr:hypothetical protein DL93DRAFT_1222576 [Clavulina sp. PMI_390]
MYGHRLAIFSRNRGDQTVELFDFNPDRVRRHLRPDSWPPQRNSTELNPPELCRGVHHVGLPAGQSSETPSGISPFGGWTNKTGLPFLRTKMAGVDLRDAWVNFDMDSERLPQNSSVFTKRVGSHLKCFFRTLATRCIRSIDIRVPPQVAG